MEPAVRKDQWDLEITAWQAKGVLRSAGVELVAQEIHPGETSDDVQPGDAHRVVVVPQVRRLLGVLVPIGLRGRGQERVLGMAIHVWWGDGAVQVHRDPRLHPVLLRCAVQAGVDVLGE